jgi:hypothetical protein|tara:strand:- start:933 stop:1766 length:834 start_codon:yes stop_codon:yes gene_type:complete
MIRIVSLLLSVAILLLAEAAMGGPSDDDKQKQLLSQKLLLLDNILFRSTTSLKMKESNDPEVVKMVLQAQENTESAKSNLALGRLTEAGRSADEALKMLTSAASLSAQVQKSTLMQRSRYQELLLGLDALSEAPSGQPEEEVDRLVNQAKEAVIRDDYRSANGLLGKALDLKAAKTASMYDQKTIVYALDFDTPLEEFRYEAKQYEGNRLLLKLMLVRNQPSTAGDLVSKTVDEAQQISQEANRQSTQGNLTDAIEKMEQANRKLASALAYLGVQYK